MTLARLIKEAREVGNLFSSWEIPLVNQEGQPVSFDFQVVGSNEKGYNIVVNFQEKLSKGN